MESIHTFTGKVIQGNQIGGSRLDTPTANIRPDEGVALPKFGVYASKVIVDGKAYWGVTNVGTKPTLKAEYPVEVETYIFDLDEDLYNKHIRVELLAYLREDKAFSSLDELREQIERDKARALKHVEGLSLD